MIELIRNRTRDLAASAIHSRLQIDKGLRILNSVAQTHSRIHRKNVIPSASARYVQSCFSRNVHPVFAERDLDTFLKALVLLNGDNLNLLNASSRTDISAEEMMDSLVILDSNQRRLDNSRNFSFMGQFPILYAVDNLNEAQSEISPRLPDAADLIAGSTWGQGIKDLFHTADKILFFQDPTPPLKRTPFKNDDPTTIYLPQNEIKALLDSDELYDNEITEYLAQRIA